MNTYWEMLLEPNQGNTVEEYTDIDGINMTIEVKGVGIQDDEDLVDELKERREFDRQEDMHMREADLLRSQER